MPRRKYTHIHTHHTHRVRRIEETVANHLISIPPSSVFHLQQQRAEQNAVEQGQRQSWQSSQCRLLNVVGGGMQQSKINNLAIILYTLEGDTSGDRAILVLINWTE